jgi:hypothetical protein
MRRSIASVLVLLVVAVASAAADRSGSAAVHETSPCGTPPTLTAPRLPAPVTIRTSCGAFEIGRSGRVRKVSSDPSPVPPGAGWWPYTGVWDKLAGGHLIVGRWQKRLWRSTGSFPRPYEVGAITVGPKAIAFSYGYRVPRLYLAPLGGREQLVATGEYPIGWTRGGLYTGTSRGGGLRLRSVDGILGETLARQVYNYAYDHAGGSLYFLARGKLVRADGAAQQPIASLARLGLPAGRALQLQPLGRLVALTDRHHLVVLRRDGSVFAAARPPRGRTRVDGISSQLAAAPNAQAVAFTATRGNTAYGSNGRETAYLLQSGTHIARAVHTERVSFAVCERGASLQWRGRWLLYAASEGNTSIIDTSRPHHAIDLARTVRRVPGTSGDQGHLDFTAYWTGNPTGL